MIFCHFNSIVNYVPQKGIADFYMTALEVMFFDPG